MCRDYREKAKKGFDSNGQGYGEMLVYQGLFVASLLECQKSIKKCGNLVDVDAFEKMLAQEQEEGRSMNDLNQRIYHQREPELTELVFDKKNMMGMTIPEDLYIKENAEKLKSDEKIYCPDLELLVPKKVKEMINNYKEKMNQFIGQNLDNYENEQTISDFVQNLFLPRKLTKKPGEADDESLPPSQFPPQIWQKIDQVQQIGGTEALSRIMNGIMRKSSYLINELENLLKSLEAEDKDDQMCRQRYRDKWIRQPSQKLNFKLVQGAMNFLNSLNNTKKYDSQEQNDIMNEARYYEELLLPREQLINRIPRKDELQEKETPEETEVHEAILKLYELGDKCMQIINPIFSELNDDTVIVGQFIEVLAKKTTEQAIYDKFKEIYSQKFNELKPLSDEVKKQKQVVTDIVQKNSEKIMQKPKQNYSNEQVEYFKNLDNSANMFMKKYEKIKKGDSYYNDIYQKVSQLLKTGNDWMIKRSDEKNAILSTIKGASVSGNLPGTRVDSSDLLNPETNPFTKMNVNINRGGNYGMNYNNQRGNQGGH